MATVWEIVQFPPNLPTKLVYGHIWGEPLALQLYSLFLYLKVLKTFFFIQPFNLWWGNTVHEHTISCWSWNSFGYFAQQICVCVVLYQLKVDRVQLQKCATLQTKSNICSPLSSVLVLWGNSNSKNSCLLGLETHLVMWSMFNMKYITAAFSFWRYLKSCEKCSLVLWCFPTWRTS